MPRFSCFRSPFGRFAALRPRLEGAVILMAFTDSGWMRRFRVPKMAVAVLVSGLVGLTLATIFSVSLAFLARADLARLGRVERENRALTAQLHDQATRLIRLQTEMSRLRELEESLRAVSGLADGPGGPESPGRGGGLAAAPQR